MERNVGEDVIGSYLADYISISQHGTAFVQRQSYCTGTFREDLEWWQSGVAYASVQCPGILHLRFNAWDWEWPRRWLHAVGTALNAQWVSRFPIPDGPQILRHEPSV
jgi:hypothetical protein